MTCSTCTHWQLPGNPAVNPRGTCLLFSNEADRMDDPSPGGPPLDDRASIKVEFGYPAEFRTRADFGCVAGRPKGELG